MEEVDVTGDGVGWGRCLRIWVYIDITKPLERGRALVLNGKSIWVSFRYEKLPQFCYFCGRIYHADKPCTNKTSHRINDDDLAKPWGAWLRAIDQRFVREALPVNRPLLLKKWQSPATGQKDTLRLPQQHVSQRKAMRVWSREVEMSHRINPQKKQQKSRLHSTWQNTWILMQRIL